MTTTSWRPFSAKEVMTEVDKVVEERSKDPKKDDNNQNIG